MKHTHTHTHTHTSESTRVHSPMHASAVSTDEDSPVGAGPCRAWLVAVGALAIFLPIQQYLQPRPWIVRLNNHFTHH